MFKLMLEFNPSLDIKNRKGLTPLTLAANLARREASNQLKLGKNLYYIEINKCVFV
jgi:hypothetical protein